MVDKQTIIIVGKLPPPYIGPALACQTLLRSVLNDHYHLIHVDTSDHRDLSTLGAIDFWNFYIPFRAYIKLIYSILHYKPSLVYTPVGNTSVGYIKDAIFILIAKTMGVKLVGHLRSGCFFTWYQSCPKVLQAFIRFVHKRVDAQIVLGENLRPLFNWILPEEKIHVIPNGGNYKVVPVKCKTAGTITVLFLSNFIRSKGVLETLFSAKYLEEYKDQVQFIFAGNWRDSGTRFEFEKFVKENRGLLIRNIGPVAGEQKWTLLHEVADIFALPTYYRNEGHPWAIIEAMAAGLPIISTDQGAITESVIEGWNGFIIQPQHPDQIAEKIRYLIEHPEERKWMGENSRKHYEANFTEEKMVERLTNVFNTVLASH